MFLTTYKTTMKNLFRSVIFWITFILVIVFIMSRSVQGCYIGDTADDFVFPYNSYMTDLTFNVIRVWLMELTAIPIFATITTLLVLNRDHGDGFFEIERAGGLKPSGYFLGRLAALVTVNIVTAVVSAFMAFHWYVYSRGGVAGMELRDYLSDSTVRILRVFTLCAIPAILLFIGLTYMIGSIFKKGFAGGIIGIGYALLTFLFNTQLEYRMSAMYLDIFNPVSRNIYRHWSWYDINGAEWDRLFHIARHGFLDPFMLKDVVIWTSAILGSAVLCYAVSYVCTRMRKI